MAIFVIKTMTNTLIIHLFITHHFPITNLIQNNIHRLPILVNLMNSMKFTKKISTYGINFVSFLLIFLLQK